MVNELSTSTSRFVFDIQEINGMNISDNFINEIKMDLSGTNLEYNIEIDGGSNIIGGGIFDVDKPTYPYVYYKYLMDGITGIFRKSDTESDEKRDKMNGLYKNMISQDKKSENIDEPINNMDLNNKMEDIIIKTEEKKIPTLKMDDYYNSDSIEEPNINNEKITRIILNIKDSVKDSDGLREYKRLLERRRGI